MPFRTIGFEKYQKKQWQDLLKDVLKSLYLNKLFIETDKNYSPDLIIFGHSDNLNIETFEEIRKIND